MPCADQGPATDLDLAHPDRPALSLRDLSSLPLLWLVEPIAKSWVAHRPGSVVLKEWDELGYRRRSSAGRPQAWNVRRDREPDQKWRFLLC